MIPTEALLRGLGQRKPTSFPNFLGDNGLQYNAVLGSIVKVAKRISRGEEVRVVISAPPRHGKTDGLLHLVAWLLSEWPNKVHAYTTYGQNLANTKSRKARRIAEKNGVRLAKGSKSVVEWMTEREGGLLATGAGGPLTGKGITGVGIIDDPFKNRQEADSALIRERVWEWYTDVFYPRLEPGSSVVVIATRWHEDDLSGRLINSGWEHINLPAIDEEGDEPKALWPERFPLEKLLEIREKVGEYTWASLYQGQPRPRGGVLFRAPTWYLDFPSEGFQLGHGFDAAYTAKTYADYSVTVTGRMYGDKLYLTNMIRDQIEANRYISILKAQGIDRITWFRSGTEKGLVEFLEASGISVNDIPATADKFVRAQPVVAAWNSGDVLLPSTDPDMAKHGLETDWVEPLLKELQSFTGVNDLHDDIVDALAALHHDLGSTFEVFTV